jgi:hypothetical protein
MTASEFKVRKAFAIVKNDVEVLKKEVATLRKELNEVRKTKAKTTIVKVPQTKIVKVPGKTKTKVVPRTVTKRIGNKTTYAASKNGGKFHEIQSINAKNIKSKNRIIFKTEAAAKKAGFKAGPSVQ